MYIHTIKRDFGLMGKGLYSFYPISDGYHKLFSLTQCLICILQFSCFPSRFISNVTYHACQLCSLHLYLIELNVLGHDVGYVLCSVINISHILMVDSIPFINLLNVLMN